MYFIHIEDPQFHEAPWPGVRRLGPFETKKQAEEQAAAERLRGIEIAGIHTGTESQALSEPEEGRWTG